MHKLTLLLLFSSLAVFPANAQVTGKLSGSVSDQSGAVIPDATVSLFLAGGTRAIAITQTTAQGLYTFPSLSAVTYDVIIEKTGFLKHTTKSVKVDPGKETSIPETRLGVTSIAESIEVTAAGATVQTTTAEVSNTVTNAEVSRLPLINRTITNLLLNQAGVNNGRGSVTVNGMRSSYSNVTLDGINIQDNYIRQEAIGYSPNILLIDQISEVTVATSNASAASPGGGAQFTFTSRSGTNNFHGAAHWYNRNNALAASDWFSNRNGISKPFLNQNQFGGNFGGPIKKDKLFFYGYGETLRRREQASLLRSMLTDSARQGNFIYRDTSGNVQQVNLLRLRNVSVDPVMADIIGKLPAANLANSFQIGDSSAALTRNTIGYAFQARDNRNRNNTLGKIDYIHSPKHSFAGTYAYNTDFDDRSDSFRDFNRTPAVVSETHSHFLSLAWRFNPRANIVNELRGGFNLAPGAFRNSAERPPFYVQNLVFDNPITAYDPQGRSTDTYNLSNTTTWFKGAHNLQFGYQMQKVRSAPYNLFNVIPRYTLRMGQGQNALTPAEVPGISAIELQAANDLLANLGGFVDEYLQTFNVTSRNSGFVNGAQNLRHYQLDNHAFFLQDSWKAKRRLTVNAGLRWEYQTPMRERDGLFLLPVLENGNYITTMARNSTLDFAGSKATRDLYKRDFNNFGPNIGLAWDVFGNGRTAVRAGYSIFFANDQIMTAIDNSANTNDGLAADATAAGLRGRLSSGRPQIPVPTFKVPRTFADNFLVDPAANAAGMPDPGLVTPYIQHWNFSIQQEVKGTLVEARYVGTKSTNQLRALDFNQVDIRAGGFLDDFKRARNNGFLARASGRAFDPRYNAAIPGSQRTPVFDSMLGGGFLTAGAVVGPIERGEVAALAHLYASAGITAPFSFYPNSTVYGANIMMNIANTTYHSLQFEARRRFANGLHLNTNYSFSKAISDALGDGQVLFEPYLDQNNGKLEKSRSPFDLRHNWKANFIYELPIARLTGGSWKRLTEGWSTSGLMFWQSGTPFSVLSPRGTLNRGGVRSNSQTVNTTLNGSQLKDVVGFFMTGNGPRFINPANIGPDGRGVAADGATFNGQVFFNPEPGATGALGRRIFDGPSVFSFDFSVMKQTRLTERYLLEIRMDSSNILNHPTFYVGDESAAASLARFNVNSTTFGQVTGTFTGRRQVQFGVYLRF